MQKDKKHQQDCSCYGCKYGLKALRKLEQESMKKYGWYANYVQPDYEFPYETNFHTHGFDKTLKHLDIQIVFPMKFTLAHELFNILFYMIKDGAVFKSGVDYDGIMENGYKVRFMDAEENGRKVLRLLVPDVDGKYEGTFAEQLFLKRNPN